MSSIVIQKRPSPSSSSSRSPEPNVSYNPMIIRRTVLNSCRPSIHSPRLPAPRLLNFIDTNVIDDRVSALMQVFLKAYSLDINTAQHMEVEGKLGRLYSKGYAPTPLRFEGVQSSTVLVNYGHGNFRSGITADEFNDLRQNVLTPALAIILRKRQTEAGVDALITEKETLLRVDETYDVFFRNDPNQFGDVRTTFNDNWTIRSQCTKHRQGDIMLSRAPSCKSDIRISASLETTISNRMRYTTPLFIRHKQRISYPFDKLYSIDITCVQSWSSCSMDHRAGIDNPVYIGNGKPIITYEVEMEILDARYLQQQCQLHKLNGSSALPAIAQWFLENMIRLSDSLIRKVKE